MARPQVADGGSASNMEGSSENVGISRREQPTRGGPPAWWLGEVLTTPHCNNVSCYEMFTQKFSDLD
jgi:hypothetical protein